MNKALLVRILPFTVFMAFIGLQQGLDWLSEKQVLRLNDESLLYLYPVKVAAVAAVLFVFRHDYPELRFRDLKQVALTGASVLLGLLVFVLWINMDWPFAVFGESPGYNPSSVEADNVRNLLILCRVLGAALIVPIMEELFWRSFLLRYIINADFMSVRIGTYTLTSFLVSSVLFGLEHHLILAGIMAGAVYNLLLYRTQSLAQCVLSHAVTNLALAIYVLQTGQWQFW